MSTREFHRPRICLSLVADRPAVNVPSLGHSSTQVAHHNYL